MKKILISLFLVLASTAAFAQKYQGDISVSLQIPGVGISTSHGVKFATDYVGIGAECAASLMIFVNRAWTVVYADYRHYFNLRNGHSLFLQADPGVAYSSQLDWFIIPIPDSQGGATLPINNYEEWSFYSKVGFGYQWNYTKTFLNLALNCAYFSITTDSGIKFYPSISLTFGW